MTIKFKIEVLADSSGKWATNMMIFNTAEEAGVYARDLARRWTLVRDWRIIEVEIIEPDVV